MKSRKQSVSCPDRHHKEYVLAVLARIDWYDIYAEQRSRKLDPDCFSGAGFDRIDQISVVEGDNGV